LEGGAGKRRGNTRFQGSRFKVQGSRFKVSEFPSFKVSWKTLNRKWHEGIRKRHEGFAKGGMKSVAQRKRQGEREEAQFSIPAKQGSGLE
jgi:hypothetical protein